MFLKKNEYKIEKNEEPQTIAEFECRGWDICEFIPKGNYICDSIHSDTVFKEVDLQERDWAEYDDEGDCQVGIYDVVTKSE